jgi:serine/threonine protein kinase
MAKTLRLTSDTLIETQEYVALEVLTNESYSFSADICSLGCIIFEMMFKKSSFFHDINLKKCFKNKIQIILNEIILIF